MSINSIRLLNFSLKLNDFVNGFKACSFSSPKKRKNKLITLACRVTGIYSDANTDVVTVLTERLKKAEKRLNLLTCEISSIKSELLEIQQTSGSSSRQYSTSTKNSLETDDANDGGNTKRPRYEFTKENDYVVVYTDGSCVNNGRFNAKAGIGVWFGNNHPLNVSEPVKGRPTNNTAEIQACVKAVNVARSNGIAKLKIRTDSQFVINSMTQWIHKWKKNNWKVTGGGSVKNKEDFVILDNAMKLLDDIQWEHVEGHKGIVGNEEADRLATAGASLYKSNTF